MAKRKMMAKVHYNQEKDAFELWIKAPEEDDWGFSCSTKCQAIEAGGDADFIHFTFLKEVLRCVDLGFDVFEG